MADARSEYRQLLLRARRVMRRNGGVIAGAELRELLLEVADDLMAAAGEGTVSSKARARRLRQDVMAILDDLGDALAHKTDDLLRMTVREVEQLHRATLRTLSGDALAGRLSGVQLQTLAHFRAGGQSPASTFKTLMNRHILDAAPVVDRVLEKGLAQGASSRQVTEALARTMLDHPDFDGSLSKPLRKLKLADLRALGAGPSTSAGLRTLYYDARRIAVSTINNGYREANAAALEASPVVEAVAWTLSAAHHIPCACEDLAMESSDGYPPSYYRTDDWPSAPHPFCACYQSDVMVLPPSKWR